MSLSRVFSAMLAVMFTLTLSAPVRAAEVTKPITKPFLIGDFVFKVLSIQTVATVDQRPVLAKMNDCTTPYIMVAMSVQNNDAGDSHSLPGVALNFELADGSDLNGPQGDGAFLFPSFANLPSDMHPKEHKNLVYITCGWNGQAITKMFFSAGGDLTVRMFIPKNYVKVLTPVGVTPSPAASPSP